jgi:hypothetical protein
VVPRPARSALPREPDRYFLLLSATWFDLTFSSATGY